MATRFLLLAALVSSAVSAGGCAVPGPTTEWAYAPDAKFHADLDACSLQKACDPLCIDLFQLGPNADIQECVILLRDSAGARVRVTFWGDNGGWASSVAYDGGGFLIDDSGDSGGGGDDCSDGTCDDGSTDGTTDGTTDDGSTDGGDSRGDSGDGGDSSSFRHAPGPALPTAHAPRAR